MTNPSTASQNLAEDVTMPEPGPKYAFSHEDLSVYERIDPYDFENFDEVDSTTVDINGWTPPAGLGQRDGH